MDLALLVLFNTVVGVLYHYEILPPLDADGKIKVVKKELKGGTVVCVSVSYKHYGR